MSRAARRERLQRLVDEVRALRVSALTALSLCGWQGLPVLDPATWRSRDCACGMCAVCRFYRALGGPSPEVPLPRRAPDAPRWPSLSAALACWVLAREDGYQVAGLGAALEALATLGGWTSSVRRAVGAAQLSAEDVADVDLALRSIEGTAHLTASAHREILIARVVGRTTAVRARDGSTHRPWLPVPEPVLADEHGCSVEMVRAATRRAAKQCRLELAQRGLIPTIARAR